VAGSDIFCGSVDIPGTPQDVIPEPATMSLLAMGLAGLAATGRRRRNPRK
jgi:hypothetical protein